MPEFVEEALDEIAFSVMALVERRQVHAVGHEPDIGACAACRQFQPQGVGIVAPIAQQDIAATERSQHVLSTGSVMGLTFGDLQQDGQATGIDEGVDLGGQSASRATHATGSRGFFWPLAAC
ncbi:MAG TPA: hypothetical protein VMH86_02420 [Rhizomicrobium sp.]|nr:hypothetical protein [Rhizomicrobium sp.]